MKYSRIYYKLFVHHHYYQIVLAVYYAHQHLFTDDVFTGARVDQHTCHSYEITAIAIQKNHQINSRPTLLFFPL